MPSQSDLRFTFAVVGGVDFEVIEFDLYEALSETFRLDVQLAHANAHLDFASILDQPAVLTIWHGSRPVRQEHTQVGGGKDDGYERYDYPGCYKQDAAGRPFTENRLLGHRRDARLAVALTTGQRFQIDALDQFAEDKSTRARQALANGGYRSHDHAGDAGATEDAVGDAFRQLAARFRIR